MYSMDVLEVFSLDQTNETPMYEDCGNSKQLYHSSKLSNRAGILSGSDYPSRSSLSRLHGWEGCLFADMSSK
jgi:hypothetical protein